MKRLREKKPAAFLLGLVLILILSMAAELLWFNGRVLFLEETYKGVVELDFASLEPSGLIRQPDGTFLPDGDDIGFAIEDDFYIHRLQIHTTPNTPAMQVAVSGMERTYDLNPRVKAVTIIPVGQNARDVWFSLLPAANVEQFEIDSVVIDNSVEMNWLRVFLMVSVGAAALFFLIFRETALTKLHMSFLVLALVLGINMAAAVPTWYGMDEHAHFVRAYQLAQGNLGFDDKAELQWIEQVDDFFYQSGSGSASHNSYRELVLWLDTYSQTDYPLSRYIPTTAATYPFVPYFFGGLGIFAARLAGLSFGMSFFAGRIFNVLGYALICAAAIKIAKLGKRLLFVMALLPYALFSAGVYTADTFTVAFAILAAALYGNMLCSEDGSLDWKLPTAFGLCCGLLALCKLPYAAFCALILSVPLKKFKTGRDALVQFGLVFLLTGGIALATLLFGADKGIIQWYKEGMSIVGQIKYILLHPIAYIKTMLWHVTSQWREYLYGSTMLMGYTGRVSGLWAASATVLLAVIALLDREPGGENMKLLPRLACLAVTAGGWVLCLTALYVSYNIVANPFIDGVQGRYFYPLLLPLLLMAKNGRLALPLTDKTWNGVCCGASAALGLMAVLHVFSGYCM